MSFLFAPLVLALQAGLAPCKPIPDTTPTTAALPAKTMPSIVYDDSKPISQLGLSGDNLEKFISALPADKQQQAREDHADDETGYQCPPLEGPRGDECTMVAVYIANNTTSAAIVIPDSYCFDLRYGNCRVIACAESNQSVAVETNFLANTIKSPLIEKCSPTMLGGWWQNNDTGLNVFLASF